LKIVHLDAMRDQKTHNILFFISLTFITVLFLYLLRPFFYPIFWAAVFASLFRPLYTRLARKAGSPNLAAAITLLAIVVIILLPLTLIGTLLVNESFHIYTSLSGDHSPIREFVDGIPDLIMKNPYVKRLHIDEAMLASKFSDFARDITNFIFNSFKGMTQNTVMFAAMFLVMLYALFFFIRDGEWFLQKAAHLFPLGEKREQMIYERFTSAARATLKGTLIIAFLQGSLGGLLFFAVGIEGALIWWVLMVFLAVIPGVGCSIVWFPAGLVMLFTSHIWEGVTIFIVGVFVISSVDNFLRPILVGRDIQMHPLLILFSTLGGIALFGFSGVVIGPIITALLFSLWEMAGSYFGQKLPSD
jgi:predicted PurR-regulated permease PerM